MKWDRIEIQIYEETAADKELIQGEEVFVRVPGAVRDDYGVQLLRKESAYFGVYLGRDEFDNCIISDLHDLTTKVADPRLVTPMGGTYEM